jgi:outer membrane protein OmpA-like peptidoglycan-associated protein
MNRPLSPLQIAILGRVQHLDRVPEGQLRSYLVKSINLEFGGQDQWEKEFLLAVDLLCLYGALRFENHPRKGRVFISAKPSGNPTTSAGALREGNSILERLRTHATVPLMASVLLGAGCTLIPSNDPPQPPPSYNPDGWMAPSRIEQFFNRGKMVYRYCHDDECPSPTPKVTATAQRRIEPPRYDAVATTRQATPLGTTGGVVPAETEKMAKDAAPVVKPAAALVAVATGASMTAAGKAVAAASPTMLATLTNKETPPVGITLRTDGDFTSYKGMVGFQQGSMVLDGLNRQKVSEMASQAREAERVRLRGRVATTQLSEEMKKLAVGRAYAVKVEFVKHDVDKAKIRILSPQQSSGENATGTVRGVDVMLDMPERKFLSGTVKEGA